MVRDDRTDDLLPYNSNLFDGTVALVTGAGSGIGRETALTLARLGASVMLCGRTEARLRETAEAIDAAGGVSAVFPMTIRDPEAAVGAIEAAWSTFGRLDILVNNAGGQYPQAAIDLSVKGWKAVVETNLDGTWFMMQSAARSWRDRGRGGSIVNIVLNVWRGIPGMAHSVAARAGIIYLSKTVAVEWAPLDIRVNCIAPGLIESSGLEHYPDPVRRKVVRDSNPMRRLGQPRDIANAVVFLAGPTGSFVTGEVLTVDGGGQLWGDIWGIAKPDYFRFDENPDRKG